MTDKMSSAKTATLAARLQAASHAYHNGLELLMTDEEFDAGVDALRAAAPTHPFLKQVGAPVAAGDEVALPIPLPSLNKVKPDDGAFRPPSEAGGSVSAGSSSSLEKWLSRNATETYHVSVKLDGCSALWLPATGKLYTRGDGMLGRDISAFVPYIKGLVKPAQPMAIRGELIMRTDSPAIPTGKLARNIVAGALNRKDVDPTLFAEIRFVTYELINLTDTDEETGIVTVFAGTPPEEAYKLLRILGFEMARSTVIPAAKVTPTQLSEIFSKVESISEYQLDGIVIAPNKCRPAAWTPEVRKGAAVNPEDRVAWKTRLTASSARTTVTAVDWNVSATGMLIPRVLFDSVTLAGANIGAATGLHGRWIYDNGVGPGAVIEVRRAGDVIPQIIAVHTSAPGGPAMPAAFEWDTGNVHVRAAAPSAEQTCIQITRALSEMGAENVGPGVVSRLYTAGFNTVGKIYAASATDFSGKVESCGPKMASRIYEGLRVGQGSWTELTFMLASCTMPRGVAKSKLLPLFEITPVVASWSAATFKAARPAGLSEATIDAIVAAVPAYLTWRTANILPTMTTAPVAAAPPPVVAPAAGQMVVVLTGFRDKALETALTAAGHVVADAVSKKTTHVVHSDGPTPTSTKITKAQDVGALIMSVSAFRGLLI